MRMTKSQCSASCSNFKCLSKISTNKISCCQCLSAIVSEYIRASTTCTKPISYHCRNENMIGEDRLTETPRS